MRFESSFVLNFGSVEHIYNKVCSSRTFCETTIVSIAVHIQFTFFVIWNSESPKNLEISNQTLLSAKKQKINLKN